MTVGLAFFHGWGLGPHFWQALAAALPGHPHAFFDAGYTGAVQQPDYTLATHWVAVGHSLGWAHALQNPPTGGWLGMVSLSGFTRFCAQAPDDVGVVELRQRLGLTRRVRGRASVPQRDQLEGDVTLKVTVERLADQPVRAAAEGPAELITPLYDRWRRAYLGDQHVGRGDRVVEVDNRVLHRHGGQYCAQHIRESAARGRPTTFGRSVSRTRGPRDLAVDAKRGAEKAGQHEQAAEPQ